MNETYYFETAEIQTLDCAQLLDIQKRNLEQYQQLLNCISNIINKGGLFNVSIVHNKTIHDNTGIYEVPTLLVRKKDNDDIIFEVDSCGMNRAVNKFEVVFVYKEKSLCRLYYLYKRDFIAHNILHNTLNNLDIEGWYNNCEDAKHTPYIMSGKRISDEWLVNFYNRYLINQD